MIKSITVTNVLGEFIKLELGSPEKSGFQVLDIQGLGPSKANINIKEIPTIDGALFNSSRVTSRNIVLKLGFQENSAISEIATIELVRQVSYRFFPVKRKISLLIETDTRLAEVDGYVESNELDIFADDNEKTSISIICPDSYLFSTEITTTLFSGVVPGFQFPFSNESLVTKLLFFGDVFASYEKNIYYTGDSEVGIVLYIHAIGPVVNPVIVNSRTLETMTINTTKLAAMTGSGIIAGDDITITTIKGQKSITLLRAGVTTNILNTIDQNSTWFSLLYGDNLFKYDALTGKENLQVSADNQTIYQGV